MTDLERITGIAMAHLTRTNSEDGRVLWVATTSELLAFEKAVVAEQTSEIERQKEEARGWMLVANERGAKLATIQPPIEERKSIRQLVLKARLEEQEIAIGFTATESVVRMRELRSQLCVNHPGNLAKL